MPRIKEYKKEYMVRDFSHYVRDKCRDQKMSQTDLAEALGMSQQKLSYKINSDAFTYADFLAILEFFKPEENELIRLVKSW